MTRILMALGVTPSRTPRHRKPGRPSIRPARPVARDAGSARPLVLIAVVFVLVLALNFALGPLLAGWPLPLRLLLTVTLQVVLMTYVIMPRLTPRIARFIYPTSRTL